MTAFVDRLLLRHRMTCVRQTVQPRQTVRVSQSFAPSNRPHHRTPRTSLMSAT